MTSYNEKILLEKAAQGDAEAFGQLFYQKKDKLYSFLLKYARSEDIVEDIIQDVFLKLWTGKEHLAAIENIDGYLITLSKNQLVNIIRRQAKESSILTALSKDLGRAALNDAPANLALGDTEKKLSDTINKLPKQQKVAFYLSRHGNLKHEEIASLMQISKNTVRNHIIQAMQTLKKSLTSLLFSAF